MPSPKLISEAAAESGIDPAFIEKDWYAVQLLKSISEFENDLDVNVVFSGGTSLSKGFGLIKRFSEDLDFFLCSNELPTSGKRRSFRRLMMAHVVSNHHFDINNDSVIRGDGYRFFKAPVHYDMNFNQQFLRPYLQLEMTFFKNKLPPIKQNIQSIVSELAGGTPETEIACISPIETAADKLSALSWRVVVRDRASNQDDPTMIRHLHDLAALKNTIFEEKEMFLSCALQSLQSDQERRRGGEIIAGMSISDRLQRALELLSSDNTYRNEYQEFVQNMSYADIHEQISFDDALLTFEELINIVS